MKKVQWRYQQVVFDRIFSYFRIESILKSWSCIQCIFDNKFKLELVVEDNSRIFIGKVDSIKCL